MYNLLKEGLGTVVEPTNLSRKLTIDGETKAYPVYRVRLDQLFYNDQNDRIATWLTQYRSEHGVNYFDDLSRAEYNSIIERFIIQSNETAIEKTQMNISLVRQREPGVILSDGRVIDGNRRFTCLRRLAEKNPEFNWFETVILDTSLDSDKKQIKMLELTIQHGEEKKVDYNPIERLVGLYQDVVETGLLSVEEYAYSTNETEYEVKKRIESALIVVEFLEYIRMPKQWHIARDYQIVSVISDLQPLLRKCATPELKQKVKNAVFANILMRTIGDSRKYIHNLNSMMNSGFFMTYIKEQERIGEILAQNLDRTAPESKNDIDFFVSTHEELAEDLKSSLDKSLLKAKKRETRNKPSRDVQKAITMLKGVDTKIFEKLNDEEKDNLRSKLEGLSIAVNRIDTAVKGGDEPKKIESESIKEDSPSPSVVKKVMVAATEKPRYYIAKRHFDEPNIFCLSSRRKITNLSVSIEFELEKPREGQKSELMYRVFFIDEHNEVISDVKEIRLKYGEVGKVNFMLASKASSVNRCMLAMQSDVDSVDELQQLIPFEVSMSFTSDFDF